MKKLLASLAVIFLMLGVLPAVSQAQGDDSQDASNQPVKLQPGVARVSFIHGDVSSQRGDNGDWVAVTLNTPVVEGDRVATGQKSRAELQLDWADVLRMADNATARVAALNRTNIQVQVGQGLTTYTVLKGSEANSEIDTPNAAVHPNGPGEYRILVNSDAETQVVVRQGSAEISTPQGSTHVDKGEMITIAGTENAEYRTARAPGQDDWDAWNNDRNRRISSAESWRKTDRYYTGSEDLDAYGRWSDVPDYGPVWIPYQGPGWAPYRDGRWVYEPYYGWTWVSYEPWGWAPYHYGRWFVYGGSWAWWPGPVAYYPGYYPVWAPAYVSFFGFGGSGWGVSLGFGFGGYARYGWLPCGPGDWYHPWYGRWGNRVNVINVTNIRNTTIVNNYHDGFAPLGRRGRNSFSNIDQAFRNNRVRDGLSSMPGRDFGRASVPRHQERISEASFRQASMMRGKMPVTPSRASFSPSDRAANPSAFRNAPPSSQRFFTSVPRANRGIDRSAASFSRPSDRASSGTPARAMDSNRPASRASAGSSQPGWRTFRPSQSGNVDRSPQALQSNRDAVRAQPPAQSNRPGWRTFTPQQSSRVNPSPQAFGADRRAPSGSNRAPAADRSNPSPVGRNSAAGNQGSWQHYTPPPRQSQPRGFDRGSSQPNASPQRQFRPPAETSRGNYPAANTGSRPPLNMRQPIVRPRGGSYGYGGQRPTYSQPRGGYSAPRGGSSAPRGQSYSAPRGGGGGGNNSGGGGGGGNRGGENRGGGGRSG
ncbi:MAG TPA: DUF6600 domain-containing protein, partial [Candidatus Polarisedimenticolia bacterium]|nr:DUF6600 domain-containing protein [Candidatus Polarisedimenticolia bacterium]